MLNKQHNIITRPSTFTADDVRDIKRLKGPILVIGASGFIGANLMYNLSSVRNDVFACAPDATKSWRLSFIDESKKINLDILNKGQLKEVILPLVPGTVFNMSAYGAYSSQADATSIHMTNYIGTLYLVEALLGFRDIAFVQAGSSSEYGLNCRNSKEHSELMPNSGYSVSKIATSYMLKYYGKIHNFPCAHLRFYSIYGPWEEKARLIPTLIQHGFEGTFPPFTQKDISRDYVFVEDCVRACVKAALTVCRQNPGKAINVASGKKTTMEGVARAARKVFGIRRSVRPSFGSMENRKWDQSQWYGNPVLAKKELGWSTRIDLVEGLIITADWQEAAKDLIP